MAGTIPLGSPNRSEEVRPTPVIAPSVLSADLFSMQESLASVQKLTSWVHLDVMDGHFVPNMTFGPPVAKAVRSAFPEAILDVHLMVEKPEVFVDYFFPLNPSYLVFHVEAAAHSHRLLQEIKSQGCRCGVAVNPGTPVEAVFPLLSLVDLVLIMSVNPGFGGQEFIPETLEKVEKLYRLRILDSRNFLIQIDGGVSAERATELVRRGCDVLVAGSAVFGSPSPEEAVRNLSNAALKGVL